MYVNTELTLLFVVLLYSFISLTTESTFACEENGMYVMLSNEKVTWKQAYDKCHSEGGKLITPVDIPCKHDLSAQSDIWMPGVFVETPAIYIKGCYGLPTENERSFTLRNNDISTCYDVCYEDSPRIMFFALQGDLCRCFNEKLDTGKLKRGICNITCEGNHDQMCGGTSIYSVFEIAPENFTTKDEKVCGYFIAGQQNIKFETCNDLNVEKRSFCKPWVSNKSDPYTDEAKYLSWDQSEYNCQSHESSLADLNPDVIKDHPVSNTVDIFQYWIGLRKWIYSDLTPDASRLLNCTVYTDNGKKNVSCGGLYQYICITDKKADESNIGNTTQTTVTSFDDQRDSEISEITSRHENDVIKAATVSYTKGIYEIILGICACVILLCILLLIIYKRRLNRMRSSQSRDTGQNKSFPQQTITFNREQPETMQTSGDDYNHLHFQNKREPGKNDNRTYDVMKPLSDDLYDHTCHREVTCEPNTENEYSHTVEPTNGLNTHFE